MAGALVACADEMEWAADARGAQRASGVPSLRAGDPSG